MDPKLANLEALPFNALKMTQKSKAILPTSRFDWIWYSKPRSDQDQILNYVANAWSEESPVSLVSSTVLLIKNVVDSL